MSSHSSRSEAPLDLERPLRVLLLLHSLDLTGAPKVALDAVEAMGASADVRMLARQSGPLEDRCRALGSLDLMSHLSRRGPLLRRLRGRKSKASLELELKHWKPDVIYANTVAIFPFVAQLDLPRAPVLLHVHELGHTLSTYAHAHPDLMHAWPARYVAVSQAVKNELRDMDVSETRIALIHEFVRDADFAESARHLQNEKRGDTRFVVGGAGAIQWRKGAEMWLHMAAELRDLMGEDRVRFVWVGVSDNEWDGHFRDAARKLRLTDCIEFVAVTERPLEHFARFDAFAMTSWEDPCPIVVLENMMLGKPVACFAGSGGAPEEVGDCGLVVPDFRPRLMAEALASLADDSTRRQAMGNTARERVAKRFTASVQVPLLCRELERAAREERAEVT